MWFLVFLEKGPTSRLEFQMLNQFFVPKKQASQYFSQDLGQSTAQSAGMLAFGRTAASNSCRQLVQAGKLRRVEVLC